MAGSHLRTQRRVDRRMVIVVLVAAVVGLVIGACVTWFLSDDLDLVAPFEPDVAGAGAFPDRSAADTVADPVAEPTAAGAVPDPGPITLAFAGDIYSELSLADRLARDHDGFVGPFAEVLRSADLAVGNLEAAIATRGSPVDKEFTFRSPPGILDALRAGGFDVLSAANNHALDFGASGLEETLAVKRAQSDGILVGIGGNEDEAFAPYTTEVGGHRVAVIAATQVIDGTLLGSWTATADRGGLASAKRVDRLVDEVRRARADADTVVVDGRKVLGYEWRPGRIVDRVPQPLAGDEAASAVSEWNALRDCTGLTP